MPVPSTPPGNNSRSLKALDALNFFLADVRDGVGPYLAIYLKQSKHWDAGNIGIAMALSSIVAAVAQIPAGLIVDGTKAKRVIVVISALAVGLACLVMVFAPTVWSIYIAQGAMGIASAFIPPVVAALALGLVGRKGLDNRISRNEGFNHAGNLVAAILVGVLAQSLGYPWIFYLLATASAASVVSVLFIKSEEINHEVARGEDDPDCKQPMDFKALLQRRDLIIFILSVVLFHFANAAMLPMAGQELAQAHKGAETLAMSACIIAAQLVMVGVAWGISKLSEKGIGRKPLFLIAFAALPVRGLLFLLTSGPVAIVGIQLLDGLAAGIFGVVSILMAADLMRGTGRFNFAQGLMALAVGLGASLSNATAGFVVKSFHYQGGFTYLTVISILALIVFAVFMPETLHAQDDSISSNTDGTISLTS